VTKAEVGIWSPPSSPTSHGLTLTGSYDSGPELCGDSARFEP
jgi:hypothetical protein